MSEPFEGVSDGHPPGVLFAQAEYSAAHIPGIFPVRDKIARAFLRWLKDQLDRPGKLISPLQGTVLKVLVRDGDMVAAGQVICVIEAMKMENEIAAPVDGVVRELGIASGQGVTTGQLICVVAAAE